MLLPRLAYVGYGLFNFTALTPGGPAYTPRGISVLTAITGGVLELHGPKALEQAPAAVPDTGPLALARLEPARFAVAHGTQAYRVLGPSGSDHLDIREQAAAKSDAAVVRLGLAGIIRIDAVLREILRGKGTKSMVFGETDYWKAVELDTNSKLVGWLNQRVLVAQGRVIWSPFTKATEAVELRFWTFLQ